MGTVRIVMFPHPQKRPPERKVGAILEWNTRNKNDKGTHWRKLLGVRKAQYIENGFNQQGDIIFVGEWEPPSRVIRKYESIRNLKTWDLCLHEPLVPNEAWRHMHMSTDPLVLGERFVYSHCRQKAGPHKSNTVLRSLETNSIILFCMIQNKYGFKILLDTVFVVNDYFGSNAKKNIQNELTSDVVNLANLRFIDKSKNNTTIYRGRTYQDSKEFFSFVPAKPIESFYDGYWPPDITHLMNGDFSTFFKLNTSRNFRSTEIDLATAPKLWKVIADEVIKQGYVLAHHLPEPQPEPDPLNRLTH